MAMVPLSNQQKETLKTYADFREECKWGLLNKVSYWLGQDGAAPPGNDRTRWAKSRFLAAQINQNPSSVDPNSQGPQVVDRFLVYGKNIACVNDQTNPFDPAAVLTFLVTGNHFDAMADVWFDDEIKTSLF